MSNGGYAWTDNHIGPAAVRTTATSGPVALNSLQVGLVPTLLSTDLQHAVFAAQNMKGLALSPAVHSGNMSHAPKECKELVQQLCVHVMMCVPAVLGMRRLTT